MADQEPIADVVIIGAGITGLGVLECAAEAGLSCLALERREAGSGATGSTSGLFHGGLRYLPYDAATSYAMCLEIDRLRRRAPGLMRRQPFLWPIYRGDRWGRTAVGALLDYYDLFGELRGCPPRRWLTPAEAAARFPRLAREGLSGAYEFHEWRADVPALVRSLAEAARSRGGSLIEGARVAAIERGPDGVAALRIRRSDGTVERRRARLYVNAAGPWAAEVAALAGARLPMRLRGGAHVIVRGAPPDVGLIFAGAGGRALGLYPRSEGAWAGPTDVEWRGAVDAAGPSAADREEIEGGLRRVAPGLLAGDEAMAFGVRPLAGQGGAGFLLSREHRVVDHSADGLPNLITVIGGKLTTYRRIGEETAARLCEKLGRAAPPARQERGFGALGRVLGTRRRAVSLAASAVLLAGFLARALATGRDA